jgi:hypothetical protein
MSTTTQTATQIVSITAGDVRQVMTAMSCEIRTLCQAAAHASPDFDGDTAERELAMLALQEVVSKCSLEFYLGDELVREYSFTVIDDGTLSTTGPSADDPPTGYIPEGARVRLTAMPNPKVPKEHRDHWFEMLGWTTSKAIKRPEGVRAQTYGAFASGSFGLQRQLLVNPKFDQAVAPTQNMQKGNNR